MRKASIKETGEELSAAEWARFDAAVARLKAERVATTLQEELNLSGRAPGAEPANSEPKSRRAF